MNKIVYFLFAAVIFVSSCNKNFKVGADYKEITAVYALLSTNDTAHYVKISKGFFDEVQDNLLIAQNSDSIYYNNLEVIMEELSNGTVTDTFILNRVDVNKEGYVKDSGIFAQTPNYAYKFKITLNPQRTYRLKIKNLASGKVIEGETNIINSTGIVFQKPYINTQPLNFAVPFENYTFQWATPANAVFFDVVLRFWYEEYNTNTLQTTYKHKDLPLVTDVLNAGGGGSTQAIMNNADFFRILSSELGVPPSFISRRVDTPDLMILAGGQILKTYIDASGAQGGITYDQIKPNFTNLSGGDVMGILSTRGINIMQHIPFNTKTTDSIIHGSLTQNLNFVGVSNQ